MIQQTQYNIVQCVQIVLEVVYRKVSTWFRKATYQFPLETCIKVCAKTHRFNFHCKVSCSQQKEIRDDIKQRMNSIDQYIGTFKLKQEYPNQIYLNSYLKFEKTPPNTYKQLESLKNSQTVKAHIDDDDFLQKINSIEEKGKRKKHYKSGKDLSKHPNDPKIINFLDMSKKMGYPLGIDYFREWYQAKHAKPPKSLFSIQQQKQMIELQMKYGTCWQKTCRYLENRSFQQIYYQFHNRVNPKILSGRWTIRHTLMLIVLLEHYGYKKWALIGQTLVVKSQLQCRERYCNVIDPNLGKDHYWTKQMEEKLVDIAIQYNFAWFKISKMPLFQNKTDNAIWRKFRSIIIHKEDAQIEKMLPKDNRQLAKKVLSFKQEYNSKKRRFPQPETHKVFDPNARAKQIRSVMSIRSQSQQLALSRGGINSQDLSEVLFKVKKSMSQPEESVQNDESDIKSQAKRMKSQVFKEEPSEHQDGYFN